MNYLNMNKVIKQYDQRLKKLFSFECIFFVQQNKILNNDLFYKVSILLLFWMFKLVRSLFNKNAIQIINKTTSV